MKKITYFYLVGCPYCIKANRAIKELIEENPEYGEIEIDMIDEEEHPEIIANYMYEYVPCMYIGDEKIYEAYSMQPYYEIKEGIRKTFDLAME